MASRLEVYHCEICGNLVEVLHGESGELVCCGQPMDLLEENTTDAAQEKHVPVVEEVEGGYRVSVGSDAHPMEANHYIEWIELVAGDETHIVFLEPGQAPEAVFRVGAGEVTARAYCNLHGLWKS
jgi:superoxide reductase